MATGRQPENTYQRRQVVHFRSLEKHKEDAFCLKLSNTLSCSAVIGKVASHLGLDNSKQIRLTSHNPQSQQPKPQPIKSERGDLSSLLIRKNKKSESTDILYYEVLDSQRKRKGPKKSLNIAFRHATKNDVSIRSITPARGSVVGDLLDDLKTKVVLSHPNAELRLLQIFDNKIRKVYPLSLKFESICSQYWPLHAEEIPEEEKNMGPHDLLIHVCHFTRDDSRYMSGARNFGEPFLFVIYERETLAAIKLRIQKKLHVPDDEFSKWKFTLMGPYKLQDLQDSDVVYNKFQDSNIPQFGDSRESGDFSKGGLAWEWYLGLEHSDSPPKRAFAAHQSRHG